MNPADGRSAHVLVVVLQIDGQQVEHPFAGVDEGATALDRIAMARSLVQPWCWPWRLPVAYGTSQKTDRIYPTEFLIDSSDPNFALTGLSVPTRFDMAHQVQIPFNADWVSKAPSPLPNMPLPKLGVLPANLVKVAKEAASRRK